MAIYSFGSAQEGFSSIDGFADFRSDIEKTLSPLASFNHEKADLALAERWAEEAINLSGAWISLFPKLPKEDTPNNVWDEDPDPIYANPRHLKALVRPEGVAWELTRWGVDNAIKATVVFARAGLLSEFGDRLVVPGDMIEIPHNAIFPKQLDVRPLRFRVINVTPEGYYLYRWLYMNATCELQLGDKALNPVLRGLIRR